MNDIPINKGSVIVSYTDSSWASCEDCRSRFGTLALLTTSKAQQTTTEASLLDWKSGRSSRVCRSTLAAAASAADEKGDRASFLNMYISELLYATAAYRVGPRLLHLHVTDAKSLHDCGVQENPTLSDKRSLVNVRAIQEVIPDSQLHWVPTGLQHADGPTKSDPALRATFMEWLQCPTVAVALQETRVKENNTSVKPVQGVA